MIALSHPTGNEFVRHSLRGLEEKGLLGNFYTSIACFEGDVIYRLGEYRLFAELRKRQFESTLKEVTKTNPLPEIIRQIALKNSLRFLIEHEKGMFSVDKIYQNHDRFVAKNLLKKNQTKLSGVIAYEDAALQTFLAAHQLGLKKYYDLSIGYYKYAIEIFEKEKERRPEYAKTLTALYNSEKKLERKDEELQMADKIIVASSFTAETLKMAKISSHSIQIIPYGFPVLNTKEKDSVRTDKKKIKLLYVGGLSQRKGIAEVFDTVEKLGNQVELTIIGRQIDPTCEIVTKQIAKHRYIDSLPHHKILEEMFHHDILVFPSFFEGFGMVISEAMSQGTPVITTKRTGAADFIQHGVNGWMVEPGHVDEMAEILENVIHHPELIREVGMAAKKTASLRPWKLYSKEISNFVDPKNN
jgi:glycosyltransferase involved in cell wall biosynthesis